MSGVDRCYGYVEDVIGGKIPAPLTIIQACKRFRNDLKNKKLYFDEETAENAIGNIEQLPHTKGIWQGKPFILQPFQCFIVANLFGWRWEKSRLKRFTHAYIEMPRKNGKTQLAVAIALIMFTDGEPGAEALLGATSQEHAYDLLFKPAKYMVNHCDEFRESFGIEVNARTLVLPHNDSVLKTVIKKPDDGTSPYVALVDEFHLHESSDMWSVFNTGTGARPNGSLILTTTTAGFTLGGPCHTYRDEMLKLVRGDYEDESTFTMVFEPDEGDQWDSIETARKCNPAMGVIQSEQYFESKLAQARRSAQHQSDYRTKNLSEWIGAKQQYMNMVAWQRQKMEMSIDDFLGESCFVAVDMAEQRDASSVAVVFNRAGKYYAFCEHFVPEAAFQWNDRWRIFDLAGLINVTPGNAQDYGAIRAHIDSLADRFNVLGIRFDPWQAAQMMSELLETGLEVYKQTQQFSAFSDPMKTLETAVLDGNFFHDGDPVLTYMMGNTSAVKNRDDHMKPWKSSPNNPQCKIDGAVAVIMCMKGWLDHQETGSLADWLSDPVAHA